MPVDRFAVPAAGPRMPQLQPTMAAVKPPEFFWLKGGPLHNKRVLGTWVDDNGSYRIRGQTYQRLDHNNILHHRAWTS